MKRFLSLSVIGVILIAATLTVLFARSRTQNSNRRIQNSNVRTTQVTEETKTPRKGKPLVKSLPAGAEGIEIKDNMVRLKPGYKLDKKDDGTISIARMSGGNITGTFDCACDDINNPKGTCTIETGGNGLGCQNGTCKSCNLYIKVGKVATTLMRY